MCDMKNTSSWTSRKKNEENSFFKLKINWNSILLAFLNELIWLMFTESRESVGLKYSESLIVKQDLVFLNTWGYKKIGHLRGKWSWPPSDARCWPLLSKTTYRHKQGKKEYCLQESSRPNGLKWSMGGYCSCKYGQYLTFSGVEF